MSDHHDCELAATGAWLVLDVFFSSCEVVSSPRYVLILPCTLVAIPVTYYIANVIAPIFLFFHFLSSQRAAAFSQTIDFRNRKVFLNFCNGRHSSITIGQLFNLLVRFGSCCAYLFCPPFCKVRMLKQRDPRPMELDPWALVAVGLWSIFSTADVVNTPVLSFGWLTIPRFSKWLMAEFPSSPDTASTQSYKTDNPSLKSVPTKSFDLVVEWIKAPMKSGSGVSSCSVCLFLVAS